MSAILHMQLMSFNVVDKYTIPFQGDNSMNSKLYMFAGVTALLMLTGCYKEKDKVCKEYHKTRAKGSAFIAKEAAADSVRHGLEAARAGSKEAYEAAKDKAKEAKESLKKKSNRAVDKMSNVACKAKDGAKHAAHVVADKVADAAEAVQDWGAKAVNKTKNLANKTQGRYEAAREEARDHSFPSSDKKTTRVVYEKEIHTEEETE